MTRVRQAWAFAGVLMVLAFADPAPVHADGFIKCESWNYQRQYCGADTHNRVEISRELSSGNLCRQGRTWGYDGRGIWVNGGCRAEFRYAFGGGWDGGGFARPGVLTCESRSYRYQYCNADTQGRVYLVREISTGNLCQQGRGWGYDGGGIWVDRGCRGEFRFGRDARGRDDAAIAAGVIGALAIGAAIGSSQRPAAPPPPPPQAPPPPRPPAQSAIPSWAIGSFQGWDPVAGDHAQLVIAGDGRIYLRDERGNVVNQGDLRDGLVYWNNGKKSFFAREGPGVMLADVEGGKHYYFRRDS